MKHLILTLLLACSIGFAQDSVVTDPDTLRDITNNYHNSPERPKDFIPQGDGTVMDKRTGLQWMRCSIGQTWTDNTCSGYAETYDWQTATDLRVEFAGHDDWRLPTLAELETLVYCRSGASKVSADGAFAECEGEDRAPTIAKDIFPKTTDDYYWSSSPKPDSQGNVWAVNFHAGHNSDDDKQYKLNVRLVRLVRGGQ